MESNDAESFFIRGDREIIGPVSISISLTFLFRMPIILNEHVHIKDGGLKIA